MYNEGSKVTVPYMQEKHFSQKTKLHTAVVSSVVHNLPCVSIVLELCQVQLHWHIRCLVVQSYHLTTDIPVGLRQKVAGIHSRSSRIDPTVLTHVVRHKVIGLRLQLGQSFILIQWKHIVAAQLAYIRIQKTQDEDHNIVLVKQNRALLPYGT